MQEAGAEAGLSVEGRLTLDAREEVCPSGLGGAVSASAGWEQVLTGKGQEGTFWGEGDVLYQDRGVGYMAI